MDPKMCPALIYVGAGHFFTGSEVRFTGAIDLLAGARFADYAEIHHPGGELRNHTAREKPYQS